jgi:hypothetical protein
LDEMLDKVKRGEMEVTRNAAAPFSALISAAARCGSEDASASEEDGFKSIVTTETDPFSIAAATYNDLQTGAHGLGVSPDHHTYAAFLRCIAQHCDPKSSEREPAARKVFDDACQSGEVSRLVIEGLRAALGYSLHTISGMHPKQQRPRFWSRNVPSSFR